LDLVGGGMGVAAPAAAGPRPSFPSDDFAQTAAVMSALASASGPLNAQAIAAMFKGRQVAPKVSAVLAALARTGFVTTVDGGGTYSLRRAA
jgi:DNA-binding IscR family transcriptional regulator